MVALAGNFITYSNEVCNKRTFVLTEGVSSMLRIKDALGIVNIKATRDTHQRIIRYNINKYGKLKVVR